MGSAGRLGANQTVELGHQPGLAARGVVLVNDPLDRCPVQRADGVPYRRRGSLSIALGNEFLGFPDAGTRRGNEDTVALPPALRDADTLGRRLRVRQVS